MKLRFIKTILAVVLSVSSASAQSAGSSYSVTAEIPYVTSYVFRGVELAKQSVQPSITLVSGGFSLGVWTNQPVINLTDDEVDFFGSYDIVLRNDWKLNVGGTVYWYPELDLRAGGDRTTYEPKLSLGGPLGPVTSTLTLYYDTTLKTSTIEGTLGYSRPMYNNERDTVDFGVTYGNVSPDAGADYAYWSASAKAMFRPKENLSIYLGAVYASSNLTSQRNHVYATVGISYSLVHRR
jgi:uncharacterized protein (TIGR02001 family)